MVKAFPKGHKTATAGLLGYQVQRISLAWWCTPHLQKRMGLVTLALQKECNYTTTLQKWQQELLVQIK